MAELFRDFWIRETGTGQQVAHLHDRYIMMMMMVMMVMMMVMMSKIYMNGKKKTPKFLVNKTNGHTELQFYWYYGHQTA
jgi:low temperature requirement protein LtrA